MLELDIDFAPSVPTEFATELIEADDGNVRGESREVSSDVAPVNPDEPTTVPTTGVPAVTEVVDDGIVFAATRAVVVEDDTSCCVNGSSVAANNKSRPPTGQGARYACQSSEEVVVDADKNVDELERS